MLPEITKEKLKARFNSYKNAILDKGVTPFTAGFIMLMDDIEKEVIELLDADYKSTRTSWPVLFITRLFDTEGRIIQVTTSIAAFNSKEEAEEATDQVTNNQGQITIQSILLYTDSKE